MIKEEGGGGEQEEQEEQEQEEEEQEEEEERFLNCLLFHVSLNLTLKIDIYFFILSLHEWLHYDLYVQ